MIIAIDPGSVSGAYAALDKSTGEVAVADLPVVDRQVDAAAFARIVAGTAPSSAIVERVASMPGQGVASTFRFGVSYGLVLGVLMGAGIPVHLVAPAVWKRAFGLSGPDKEASRALAIRLYPKLAGLERKRDQNRAEALLLAHWYTHRVEPK